MATVTICKAAGPNAVVHKSNSPYLSNTHYFIYDLISGRSIEPFVKIDGWKTLLDEFEAHWKNILEKVEETHKNNIPIIEENKKTIEEIHAFMASKGIGKTYRTVNHKSRATIKPTITVSSGYLDDIRRTFILNDEYESAKRHCESFIEQVRQARNSIQNYFYNKSNNEKREKKRQNDLIILGMANQMLGNPIVDILSHKNPHHAACDLIYCLIRQEPMLAFALAVQNCRDYRTCLEVEERLPEPSGDHEKEVIDSIRKVISEFKDDGDESVFNFDRWRKRDVYMLVKEDVRKMYESLAMI